MEKIFYVLIALLALSILFFAHFYIYKSFLKIFKINKAVLITILTSLTLGFILMSFITRGVNNIVTDSLYFITATWLGIFLFLVTGFALIDLTSFILKLSGINVEYKTLGSVMLSLVLVITVYSLFNAQRIQVSKVGFEFNNLEKDVKIVQLSDIHIGVIHKENYLNKIVEKTNSLNPDMVLITGDLFDGEGGVTEQTLVPLNNLKSKYGTYFVIGNHEEYLGLDKALKILKSTNITVLRNEEVNVGGIQLIGEDWGKKDVLSEIELDKNKVSVLMYHDPAGFDKAAAKGINLQLSGHIHRGQILPFQLLERIFLKYISGTYKIDNSYLYVSQGVGTWGPPMRFDSKSEIVEIDLKAKN